MSRTRAYTYRTRKTYEQLARFVAMQADGRSHTEMAQALSVGEGRPRQVLRQFEIPRARVGNRMFSGQCTVKAMSQIQAAAEAVGLRPSVLIGFIVEEIAGEGADRIQRLVRKRVRRAKA